MSAAASSNVSSTTFDQGRFLGLLQCPKGSGPLKTAVSLTPCMHRINEHIAKTHFNTEAPGRLKEAKACPVCKKSVTAYFVDHTIRNIAAEVFKDDKSKVDTLTQVCAQLEADGKAEDPAIAPFETPVKFVLTDGNWSKTFSSGAILCKEIRLGSTSPDSTLADMSLYGYIDGSLMLRIGFALLTPKWNELKSYFANLGIFESEIMPHGFCLREPNQIRQLFKILCANIQFPANEFAVLRSVIEAGDWRQAK